MSAGGPRSSAQLAREREPTYGGPEREAEAAREWRDMEPVDVRSPEIAFGASATSRITCSSTQNMRTRLCYQAGRVADSMRRIRGRKRMRIGAARPDRTFDCLPLHPQRTDTGFDNKSRLAECKRRSMIHIL